MPQPQVDLNQLAERLKQQKPIGVTRDGALTPTNPRNDGSRPNTSGTTLEPKRFF